MKLTKQITALLLAGALLIGLAACAKNDPAKDAPAQSQSLQAEKNGEVVILFTSDVHCGVERGFGYAGLKQIRDTLEAQGYTTLLVDDGDAIQGESLGTLTKGEAIIDLMNAMGYDVAIPGNHEFDYGAAQFLQLVEKAEYHISAAISQKTARRFWSLT